MNIFDHFKKKKNNLESAPISKNVQKETSNYKVFDNDKLNLKWQNKYNDNRFKDLIEYFMQSLIRDNDEKVLKNINDIFLYQQNLKKLFANKDIGDLDIKLLAISMNLLNSDNIYRKYYERSGEGISYLKFILKKIYIDACNKETSQNKNLEYSDIDLLINEAFIIEETKKYKIKDFFDEYKDILNDNISEEEYKMSYFRKDYFLIEANNPFTPFKFAENRDLFDIDIYSDNDSIKKKMDYTKMTTKEKFDFLINYITYVNSIEVGYGKVYEFPIARDAVFIEFGSQNLKKEKKIEGNISGVSFIESHYEESAVPFDPDPSVEEGSYNFKIRTEFGSYDLLSVGIRSFGSSSILFGNTIQGEMLNASGYSYFMGGILTEEGYNLSYNQYEQIIEVLEKTIFDNNASFNIATYNYIIPCMFGLIVYVESMQASNYYHKMKEKLSNLILKIKKSDINYLDKKNYQIFDSNLSNQDNKIISNFFNIEYFQSIRPLFRKLNSNFERYDTMILIFDDVIE